jgi:hypothetical protein
MSALMYEYKNNSGICIEKKKHKGMKYSKNEDN